MTIDLQDGEPAGQAFRGLSYILLAGGVVLIAPYLILGVLKIITALTQNKAYFSSSILASILVLGQLILLIPVVTIPLSALWVFQKTGDPAQRSRVYFQGALRYAPILVLDIAQTIYSLLHDAIFLPGILGVLAVICAASFLIRDRQSARA